MPVIGFSILDNRNDHDRLRAFRQGLMDAGYVEGDNVVVEYREDGQFDRLPVLAAELFADRSQCRSGGSAHSAFAGKAATTTIPIVFAVGEDPVRLGLVASLARPGGNLTGINFFNSEVAAKRWKCSRASTRSRPRGRAR